MPVGRESLAFAVRTPIQQAKKLATFLNVFSFSVSFCNWFMQNLPRDLGMGVINIVANFEISGILVKECEKLGRQTGPRTLNDNACLFVRLFF